MSFIKDQIKELRMRLLDLSNRNALLNFRHSEKALTHIRIIDELPDFLFGVLLDGDKVCFSKKITVGLSLLESSGVIDRPLDSLLPTNLCNS